MLKTKVKNILFVRTDRVGDFLLNIPLLINLKKTYPNSKIIAVISEYLKELTLNIPAVDEFIIFDKKYTGFFGKLKLISYLGSKNIGLAIISNPSKLFNWITFFANIPVRAGYDRKAGFLLTHKIKDRKHEGKKHEIEYNLDLLKLINAEPKLVEPFLLVSAKERGGLKALLKKNNIDTKRKIIVIQSQSSNHAKCWPKEYFAKTADTLISELDVNIIFIGLCEEKEKVDEIIGLMKCSVLNLCGQFKLNELAVLLKRADLLLTNDSGPMHIASLVGTPIVAIFGRDIKGVSQQRWGPWGKNHTIFHKKIGCNPCLDAKCHKEFKCLKSVTPDEVALACKNKLENYG